MTSKWEYRPSPRVDDVIEQCLAEFEPNRLLKLTVKINDTSWSKIDSKIDSRSVSLWRASKWPARLLFTANQWRVNFRPKFVRPCSFPSCSLNFLLFPPSFLLPKITGSLRSAVSSPLPGQGRAEPRPPTHFYMTYSRHVKVNFNCDYIFYRYGRHFDRLTNALQPTSAQIIRFGVVWNVYDMFKRDVFGLSATCW